MSERYVVNVEAAIYRDGSYLLAKRSEDEEHAAGTMSLVGGTVEGLPGGDDVLHRTVSREVREEVGVEVRDHRYVESGAFVSDTGAQVVNVVFLCAYESGEARALEPEEVAAVEWVDAEEVFDRPIPEFTAAYLESADELRREIGW